MGTAINELCDEQGWSDADVVQLAFHFLESEGLLEEFLDLLQSVAVERSEEIRCEDCDALMDCDGCTNPNCSSHEQP